MVTEGAVTSTAKCDGADGGPRLPARSDARTRRPWAPSAVNANAGPGAHAENAASSRLHESALPGSASKANIGEPVTVVPSSGAAMVGAAGADVSIVNARPAGTPATAPCCARTAKTYGPSGSGADCVHVPPEQSCHSGSALAAASEHCSAGAPAIVNAGVGSFVNCGSPDGLPSSRSGPAVMRAVGAPAIARVSPSAMSTTPSAATPRPVKLTKPAA